MAKKGLDMTKLAERLAELNKPRGGGGSSMGFISLKDGRNVVRILPPREGADMFYEEVFVHYGVGKSESNKDGTMIVCPTTKGDSVPCPVCEVVKELFKLSKKKDDSFEKQAKQMNRKKRVYFNAISRDEDLSAYSRKKDGDTVKWYHKDEEGSPIRVLGTGVGIFKDILGIITDPEYGDITDFEEGLDVIITKTGTGFSTNYDVKTVRKESPAIPDDAPEGLLEDWESLMNDLSTLAKVKTYHEIESIMDGQDSTTPSDKDIDDNMPTGMGKDEDEGKDLDSQDSSDDIQAEIEAALARKRGNR